MLEVICCNLVLKPLVARIRPCDVNTAVQLLVARPDDFSFPSGHTGASFAAVTALYASRSRLWILSLILAVLIAFSRLYLYVHYPSDVLAGVVIGIMAGWIGSKFVDVVWRKRNARVTIHWRTEAWGLRTEGFLIIRLVIPPGKASISKV